MSFLSPFSPLFVLESPPFRISSAAASVARSTPTRPSHPKLRRARRRLRVQIRNRPKPSLEVSLFRPSEIVGKAYQCPSTAMFTVGADVAERLIATMPHGHSHTILACAVHVAVDLLLASPYWLKRRRRNLKLFSFVSLLRLTVPKVCIDNCLTACAYKRLRIIHNSGPLTSHNLEPFIFRLVNNFVIS